MGNTFQVSSWERAGVEGADGFWVIHYSGESKEESFAKMEQLKESGAKCVKLEWR